MKDQIGTPPNDHPALFELPPVESPPPVVRQLQHPIWTENKARLIANYLSLFQLVTKHGSYIDGFAGPQAPDKLETWAAKLVLDLRPIRLRHSYLFEKSREGFRSLQMLKALQPEDSEREISLFKGDFNQRLKELLAAQRIGEREATFCLLDQRTFECRWETVVALARYKTAAAYKIELFYFLAAAWFRRAITAQKDLEQIWLWWGRKDWASLREMRVEGIKESFVERFKSELGYKSAMAWPILDHNGKDMYYMIHATDHPAAPDLMSRAYEDAVHPCHSSEQFGFSFE